MESESERKFRIVYLKDNLVEIILLVKLQLQSGADSTFFPRCSSKYFSYRTSTNNVENYAEIIFLNYIDEEKKNNSLKTCLLVQYVCLYLDWPLAGYFINMPLHILINILKRRFMFIKL